jgi:RNA polymerase primary sigma factor
MTTALSCYLNNVKRQSKLLTKEQEIELAKRIEKGDLRAKEKMIESNLRLAISIAKKYAKYGSELEDLIQDANMGLMKAVDKFDWRKGFKFSTYASWWIKQSVTRALTNDSTLLNIPSHILANARNIISFEKEYAEEFGCDPTVEEIADALDMPIKHVKAAIEARVAKNALSLDMKASNSDEGDARKLHEIIPDHSQNNMDQILDNEKIREKIIQAFKTLSKREELVLRLRFGLDFISDDDENVYEV